MAVDFKDPKVIKITVAVIIMAIIITAWYITSFSKNAEIIRLKSEELENLKSDLAEAKRNAARFPIIKEECQKLFERYKEMEFFMPPKRDVPAFLDYIYASGKNTGILIRSISIVTSTKNDFYLSNPYDIQLSGNFTTIGKFLAEMGNFSTMTNFSNLQLAAKQEDEFTINMGLTVVTYSVPEEEILTTPDALKSELPPLPTNVTTKEKK